MAMLHPIAAIRPTALDVMSALTRLLHTMPPSISESSHSMFLDESACDHANSDHSQCNFSPKPVDLPISSLVANLPLRWPVEINPQGSLPTSHLAVKDRSTAPEQPEPDPLENKECHKVPLTVVEFDTQFLWVKGHVTKNSDASAPPPKQRTFMRLKVWIAGFVYTSAFLTDGDTPFLSVLLWSLSYISIGLDCGQKMVPGVPKTQRFTGDAITWDSQSTQFVPEALVSMILIDSDVG
jgi:hypothetical protein